MLLFAKNEGDWLIQQHQFGTKRKKCGKIF
jgi:hypothetical protein